MNFRLLWILMVGLFAYLLFWEWSQESAAKAELVATTRVDEVSSGVDSVDSSNTSKISNALLIFEVFELSTLSTPEETSSTLVVATSSAFAADSCDHSQKRR